ncbi:MAG: leucine-rich repeat protein, partial [Kiritimatiellae bacterium]|nr:leucine-rich repeat protein [Kiritimatiellia bacterium]
MMMKVLRAFMLLLVCPVLCFGARTEGNCVYDGDFTFTFDLTTKKGSLIKYTGTDSEVTVPSSFIAEEKYYDSDGDLRTHYHTIHVTGITSVNWSLYGSYSSVFANKETLTSVSWPSGVKEIGGYTFLSCTNLENIPSLSGITMIGYMAFNGCSSLKSVNIHIPRSVSYLGGWAFANCTGLKTAVVDCDGIIIPSALFCGCSNLESVVFGDGIIGIQRGYYIGEPTPLNGCKSLKSVSLGRSITVIPKYFASSLSQLERVTSSGTIVNVDDYAFGGCTSLIEIPSLSAVTNIGYTAFSGCTNLGGDLELPLVQSIGSDAFYSCTGLTTVQFGENLTSIGTSAFSGCTQVATFAFSGAPPSVGSYAFSGVMNDAIGTYTDAHAEEWEAVIDENGYWKGLKMRLGNYINLQATTNLDDRINLSWDVNSRLSGARFFIERRKNEKDPFERINQNKPIGGQQFSDTTRLPNVNYYYRVVSESGVASEQAVGKRIATKEDPKFLFFLTGSESPKNKGTSGEDNVLVAGKVLTCNIYTMNTQPEPIRRVELIGTPVGKPDYGRRKHRIIWLTKSVIMEGVNLSDDEGFPAVVEIPEDTQILPQPNYTQLTAPLRCGKGMYGEYRWEVKCLPNTVLDDSQIKAKNAFPKNVYFDRDGTDNGEIEEGWDERKNKFDVNMPEVKVPNWYTFWKKDGAVPGLAKPGLDKTIIRYRGKPKSSKMRGESFTKKTSPYDSDIYIDEAAADEEALYVIANPLWDVSEREFGIMVDKTGRERPVSGIYAVAETIAHELQHTKTSRRYYEEVRKRLPGDNEWLWFFWNSPETIRSSVDSDFSNDHCVIDGGGGAMCEKDDGGKYKKIASQRFLCDSIVDDDEEYKVVDGKNCDYWGRELGVKPGFGFSTNSPDTHGLRSQLKYWGYGGYGDDELVSRVAGRNGMWNVNPDNDWAYPGERSGGFPTIVNRGGVTSTPSAKLLSVSPNALENLGESDSTANTNLYITLTGVSCHKVSNECSVTGIVYTIGVSIQGDEHVNFSGYLIDVQSNVVATAISFGDRESDSIELFFDAKEIFDNYNGGSLTLGKVSITIDNNYSTNNVLGNFCDFVVEPIEVDKDELLCNKGYILNAIINEQSETGVVATVSTKINIADAYLVSAELVSTNDELVAYASVSNLCTVGTNTFRLAFSNKAIYQNGIGGICAVKNVKLWQNDELIDVNATGAELSAVYDSSDFVPSNACIAVDLNSGRFIEPSMTTDGKLSSLRFVFDVTNGTDATIGYDVEAVLTGTNSALAASINTPIYVTNGVNQIELTIPASVIASSEVDGPYRFESIELLPQGDRTCGTTYRPNVTSDTYTALDFGASSVRSCDVAKLTEVSDYDKLTLEYYYDVIRAGRVITEVVLVDRNGDFAARVSSTNDVSVIGVITNMISIACRDISGVDEGAPYKIACLSVCPDISGESPVYADTTSLTNIIWHPARCFVDSESGSDLNDGRSWDTAYSSIAQAVMAAGSSHTIVVKEGTYAPFSTENTNIKLIAFGDADDTIIDGGGTNRCACLGSDSSQTNTILVGFTLRNGVASYGGGACGGTLKNCIIEGNRAIECGGGVSYSVLEDCQLRNNVAGYGGGAYMSILNRCLVSGNEARESYGGGVCESTAYDCVVQGNSAATYGGGAGCSELYNCTVVGNSAVQSGGGVSEGTLVNCIVWANTAATSLNHYQAYGVYSCTTPLLPGDGNIASNPRLRGAEFGGFLLSDDSPCLNAGLDDGEEAECEYNDTTNAFMSVVGTSDFFGNERVQGSHVDMGAVEGVTNACLVMTRTIGHGSLDVSFELLEPHSSLTITADESIRPIDRFEASDGRVFTGGAVNLTDITSDIFLTAYFKYYIFYVDTKKGDDKNDGFSWTAAKKTIQAAVDCAVDGEKIWVANGVYEPIVTSDKVVEIESKDGVAATVIDGGGTNRCATLLTESAGNYNLQTNTTLVGFTLINGNATVGGGSYGGTLIDCCYSNNVASGANYSYGGGSCYGVQRNCSYYGNSAVGLMAGYGGGASYGTSYECVYEQNSVSGPTNSYGGAVHNGTHYDCEIYDNVSAGYGGGTSGGTFYRTVVKGNDAVNGGGAHNAYFYDGEVSDNFASSNGGGIYGGTIYRSSISSNTARQDGGGVYNATLYDGAVSDNIAIRYGGGTFNSTVNRTTLELNVAQQGGGAYNGTMNYVVICDNSASYGGGVAGVTANDCELFNNIGGSGGGAHESSLYRCVLRDNRATNGGGTYRCNSYNSLFVGNSASGNGGGAYSDSSSYSVRNCTIVGNTAATGAGVRGGYIYNSIVW